VGRWAERAEVLAGATEAGLPAHTPHRPATSADINDITTEAELCWWEGPPWYGAIDTDEFRAIVAGYIAAHGLYTPVLPRREPELLQAWIASRAGRWPPR
jgi:hypothetical protein